MSDDKPSPINFSGYDWHPYAAEWTGADGRFGFTFHAISDEHAQIVLQEIKETAFVVGRIVGLSEGK